MANDDQKSGAASAATEIGKRAAIKAAMANPIVLVIAAAIAIIAIFVMLAIFSSRQGGKSRKDNQHGRQDQVMASALAAASGSIAAQYATFEKIAKPLNDEVTEIINDAKANPKNYANAQAVIDLGSEILNDSTALIGMKPEDRKNAAQALDDKVQKFAQMLPPTATCSISGKGQLGDATRKKLFGDSVNAVYANMVPVQFPGITTIYIHRKVSSCLKKVAAEVNALRTPGSSTYDEASAKYKFIGFTSGYGPKCLPNCGWRLKVGGTSLSNHSFATAMDTNVNHNPYCRWKNGALVQVVGGRAYCPTSQGGKGNPDIPLKIIEAFKRNGFAWGGDWTNPVDYMHFEFAGNVR